MAIWPRHRVRRMALAAALGTALMAMLLMAPTVWADPGEMAVIETRAPLEDDSDDGINAALKKALERAIRGAAAMGLGSVQISGAYRGPSYVVVQILATVAGETEEPAGPIEPGGAGGGMSKPGRWSPSRVGEPPAPDQL